MAKDAEGNALLLIATATKRPFPPTIRLQNLTVEHGVRCRIRQASKLVEDGTFSVVKCVSHDDDVRHHFLSVGAPFIRCLGNRPSAARVSQFLDTLVQLFRALSAPPRKAVQGLWAELFFMSRAQDCRALAAAWHVDPNERYDFSKRDERIEVKSTVGRARQHHFSLDQLSPPAKAKVFIASICTERSAGGSTLGALIDRLRTLIADDPILSMRVEAVLALTLGGDLVEARREAFDDQLAAQSLKFFDVATVPRPVGPIPAEVSGVRFIVDLSRTADVDLSVVSSDQGLFAQSLSAAR